MFTFDPQPGPPRAQPCEYLLSTFEWKARKEVYISVLCWITLFPITWSPFLSPKVCTLTVFTHWSYWRRLDFVLYQEMGLDRGMELSTLGKAFKWYSIQANTSELGTLGNLYLCVVICREGSLWQVIGISNKRDVVFYHKYLCFLLCSFCRLTILPPIDALKPLFERFKVFHQDFMRKYRDPSSTL